jgi:hypothetical protein
VMRTYSRQRSSADSTRSSSWGSGSPTTSDTSTVPPSNGSWCSPDAPACNCHMLPSSRARFESTAGSSPGCRSYSRPARRAHTPLPPASPQGPSTASLYPPPSRGAIMRVGGRRIKRNRHTAMGASMRKASPSW